MAKLDRSRDSGLIYGTIEGMETACYQQDGKLFDKDGEEVMPPQKRRRRPKAPAEPSPDEKSP